VEGEMVTGRTKESERERRDVDSSLHNSAVPSKPVRPFGYERLKGTFGRGRGENQGTFCFPPPLP
jgi:hypothetical protein